MNARSYDPDLALADLVALRAMIAAYGPISKMAPGRERKLIMEARSLDKESKASARDLRSVLQDARDLRVKLQRRAQGGRS